jgi:hypothetical protein
VREAFFALAGTDACTDFTVALVRMRQAYWGRGYDDDTRRAAMRDAHDEARAQYERLRLRS